jgi:hypothetical protein
MNAIEPLPSHEHAAILELVRANNLPESELACHMTRQEACGRGRHPERGGFSILSGQARAHCPAKMRELAQKWLHE